MKIILYIIRMNAKSCPMAFAVVPAKRKAKQRLFNNMKKPITEFNDAHRKSRRHIYSKCADRDVYCCTLCGWEISGEYVRLLMEGTWKEYWKKELRNME